MNFPGSPRRKRLLASGLLVLTFVAGGLAGAATDRAFGPDQHVRQQPRPFDGVRTRSVFLDPRVFDQVGATAEQRAVIQSILERRDREAGALYAQIAPNLRSMMELTRAEIRATLTPEQVTRLDLIIRERHERWRRERENERSNGSNQQSRSDSAKKKDGD